MAKGNETPGSRFLWFIEENYGGVPQFAERFGFNKSQVYRVVKGSTSPKLETCSEYGRTGLNLHWLGTGVGPWWSPDKLGRELAMKKGIAVDDLSSSSSTDYRTLVRSMLTMAEDYIVERMTEEHGAQGTKRHTAGTKSNRKRTT